MGANFTSRWQVGLGICMDINPYRFEAPFDRFEWANFHKQVRGMPSIAVLSAATGSLKCFLLTFTNANILSAATGPLKCSPVTLKNANILYRCPQAGTNLLILICAWRDNELDSDDSRRIPNYWATRLQPLIGSPVAALVCTVCVPKQ